jgi:hypothetical protein
LSRELGKVNIVLTLKNGRTFAGYAAVDLGMRHEDMEGKDHPSTQ